MPAFCALLQNEIVVVNIKNQAGAVLPGQRDSLVVNQAGVLDGINASANRVLDGLRSMRLRSDFAAKLVGFVGDVFSRQLSFT